MVVLSPSDHEGQSDQSLFRLEEAGLIFMEGNSLAYFSSFCPVIQTFIFRNHFSGTFLSNLPLGPLSPQTHSWR